MRLALCVLACLVVVACATGPVSGAAVAGAAAMVAVFDQLLAAGTIDATQHQALVAGLTDLQQQLATAASRPSLGVDEAAGIAGGTTATVLALLRVWQKYQQRRAAPPAS